MIGDPTSYMKWVVIRSAGGVVSEKRFGGSGGPMNHEQYLWHFYNYLKYEKGIDITKEDINDTPPHFVTFLYDTLGPEKAATYFIQTTPEEIEKIAKDYKEKLAKIKAALAMKQGRKNDGFKGTR